MNQDFNCEKIVALAYKYFFGIGRIVPTSGRYVLQRMGFNTVEDRYLPLPTLTSLNVLHLAKKEIYRLTAAHCASYNISLTSVNRIIKYDLQLKSMLVCSRRPLSATVIIFLYQSIQSE